MSSTMSQRFNCFRTMSSRAETGNRSHAQRGVVLVMALIMLVIVSLLATLSIRNAISTEGVSGNVRTSQLASQAAEIALRYCEEATAQINAGTVTLDPIPAIQEYASPPLWKNPAANWDTAASVAFVIPASSVNQEGRPATFKRPPECMVERMQMVASGAITTTSTYVITARGFGPEVAAANGARSRPVGSEVWMQSTIELE
jgi:type IV pilus assembly protein PilX